MKNLCIYLLLVLSVQTHAVDWHVLYDGRDGGGSLDGWKMIGPGNFVIDRDGSMKTVGGMGLFYYAEQDYEDFELEVEWRVDSATTNSGVFVRFPAPSDPWDAVEGGYEIQIDETSEGKQATGSIYSFAAAKESASEPVGEWNKFTITVQGQVYAISLNGQKVTEYAGSRAKKGYIGLQNHDPASTTWFRLVRVRPIAKAENAMQTLAEQFASNAPAIKVLTVTKTHGFRHTPAIEKTKELLSALNKTTEFEFTVTEDLDDLNRENLKKYDVLFFANATLRVDEPDEIEEDALTFRAGDWMNFDAQLTLPDRQINGRIALSGEPGDLSGLAEFTSGVQRMTSASLADGVLTMHWGEANIGPIEAVINLTSDDKSKGIMRAAGLELPLIATTIQNNVVTDWDIDQPLTQPHRDAIMDFLSTGKGFAGAHSALDALYGWNEYREMVGGGLFESHPWTQPVTITIEDIDNPATQHFSESFEIRDEIYVLDNNPRWSSHVLASLDRTSVAQDPGPADAGRSDFPISWFREHNGGRVFMTKLGHFPDVWTNPGFVQHLLQGLRTAAGRIPGNYAIKRIKETIAPNVWPDDLAIDELGNVWIVELRGKIHHYDARTGEARLVAHLETTDPTKIEHGLLGVEVDPDFHKGSPYLYLFYTEPETFINTLSRVTVIDGIPDLSTEHVLLRVPTDPMCCHQAGDLEWGPDGTLYISTGDTGMSETQPDWEISQERIDAYATRYDLERIHWSRLVDSERSAQNLQDLRGKILRINKDGSIPTDNPFYGDAGVRWEIFAYGLRNPYRFKVHPETGDVLIGVVGPDARFDYDEYVLARGGENFGWPRTIGRLFYNDWLPDDIPNYKPPFWEYTYETGGRSASVGPIYTYKGEDGFPPVFHNKVFVYDWARRWIKWGELEDSTFENDRENSAKASVPDISIPTERLTNLRDFDVLNNTTPISMELGPDGALYVAEFDGFWDAGPNSNVSRYRWLRGTEAAEFQATSHKVSLGEQVYTSRCAACHQTSGEGVPGSFPPLVNTDWVTGDANRLISTVLDGLSGEIIVNGEKYSGVMAPWRDALSDREISSVLTYIRSSWGNDAPPITAEDVLEQR